MTDLPRLQQIANDVDSTLEELELVLGKLTRISPEATALVVPLASRFESLKASFRELYNQEANQDPFEALRFFVWILVSTSVLFELINARNTDGIIRFHNSAILLSVPALFYLFQSVSYTRVKSGRFSQSLHGKEYLVSILTIIIPIVLAGSLLYPEAWVITTNWNYR